MTGAPIFIVGCPRSGTGLLRDLLRSHPRLTFPFESYVLPRLYRTFGDPADAGAARRLAGTLLSLDRIRRWELDLEPDAFADCRTFREVVERLYGAWAQKEGKPRWGDKTPSYVTEMPTLHAIFPDARFVHILRDGRDVALSLRRVPFGPRTAYGAARWWRDLVSAGRRDAARLPAGDLLEVRYEALLAAPEPTMRAVCAFIGEPFDPAVLTRSTLAVSLWPNASETVIVPTNAGKWRREMSRADAALFESVAGDLLAELGYEAAGPARPIGPAEDALRRAEDFGLRGWRYLRGRADGRWLADRVRLGRAALGARLRPGPRYDSVSSRSAASTE